MPIVLEGILDGREQAIEFFRVKGARNITISPDLTVEPCLCGYDV